MASAMRVGPEQLPASGRCGRRRIDTLDLADAFDVYVRSRRSSNAAAIGSKKPMVVVNSAGITLLDDQELQTVLAHEAGHILSDHVLYQTALVTLLQLSPLIRLPLLGGLPVLAVRSVLLEWFRAAELRPTAPRRSSTATRSSRRARCSCSRAASRRRSST